MDFFKRLFSCHFLGPMNLSVTAMIFFDKVSTIFWMIILTILDNFWWFFHDVFCHFSVSLQWFFGQSWNNFLHEWFLWQFFHDFFDDFFLSFSGHNDTLQWIFGWLFRPFFDDFLTTFFDHFWMILLSNFWWFFDHF